MPQLRYGIRFDHAASRALARASSLARACTLLGCGLGLRDGALRSALRCTLGEVAQFHFESDCNTGRDVGANWGARAGSEATARADLMIARLVSLSTIYGIYHLLIEENLV